MSERTFTPEQQTCIEEMSKMLTKYFNAGIVVLAIPDTNDPKKDVIAVLWTGGQCAALGCCEYGKDAILKLTNMRERDPGEDSE